MPLLQEIKYEEKTGDWTNRPSEEVSKAVLSMLHDVRDSVGKLENSFLNVSLARVLEVVESGKYELNGNVSTRINLSSAKSVINSYREYSEGGCQSCVSLGRETIDAQDATSGRYCQVSDPDFNKNAIGDELGVRHEGFSPKINKHYKNPCGDWKPKFLPTLDKLIELK